MGSADSSDHEAPHSGTSPAKVSPDSQQFSSSEPTVILDSGVAFHATSNLEIFSPDVDDRGAAGDCAPFHRRDGTVLRVAGVGTVESCDKNFRLPGVRYVPQLGPGSRLPLGMKTDRIRTDITDIVFVFIFMSGFGFEYG
jgi:hypothetical protein